MTALAVLAGLGVLLALDPGGVIAGSGFPDFQEMDWKQLAVWGLRTIGVVVAQLLIIVLWLWPKWRPPDARYSGTPRPGSMPAAAVSVLPGHMLWSPTFLASIIEMCQRGALRIEPVATRAGFLYRLPRQGFTEHEWERTLCDSLPSGPTTIHALDEAIRAKSDAVGDQIGAYLRRRGLYHGNPVRTRRDNDDDGSLWLIIAWVLTSVGAGLWAALWFDQWWVNALIGLSAALVYSFITAQMTMTRTGMLTPTPSGALEIGQWLGWQGSMSGPAAAGAMGRPDSMLAYAVALDVAQPWLDVTAPAPPWFGPREESSLRGAELDAAWHAFMHASEWWLSGRSDDAAQAAAGPEHDLELELLELESPDTDRTARSRTADESQDRLPGLDSQPVRHTRTADSPPVEKPKSGGCLRGCLIWLLWLVFLGVVALVVLFSLDIVSPRDKPCPLESPPIPTPAQIASAGDLFRDQCVTVRGHLVSRHADGLVLEMDRGDYVQSVNVRDPSQALESIRHGRVVTLGGRLEIEEDGTYSVNFVPDRGSDREWWRNLRENIEALF